MGVASTGRDGSLLGTMRTSIATSLLLALTACQSAPETTSAGFVSLERGSQTGLGTVGLRVATTPDDWVALWREHARLQLPQPAAPTVDFSRYRPALVLAGPRPSGGYSIAVERVHYTGGKLVVEARERVPQAGSVQTMALTSPYEVVLLPAGTVEVDFVVRH